MSKSTEGYLKSTSVAVLGGIAALALFPYASGATYRFDDSALFVAIGCAIAIVLVVMSDRLTSLKATKDSFEIHLESIKHDLEDTLSEVKAVVAEEDPRIEKAEQLMNKSVDNDLIQEAKDIGKAMKMLREVIKEYRR